MLSEAKNPSDARQNAERFFVATLVRMTGCYVGFSREVQVATPSVAAVRLFERRGRSAAYRNKAAAR